MASTSSAASSTISRGKVAIVLFTAALAAYGIYSAFETINEADETTPPATQPTLERSNAVHRRHRRPTAYRPRPGEAAADTTGDSAADTSFFEADDTEEEETAANVEANTEANQSILSQGQIGTTLEVTLGADSDDSFDSVPWPAQRIGQNMVQLLFSISEDNTRRNAYVHRGTLCNGCGAVPIRGIRYRCANCADYDLCETCEAQGQHYRTHVFYKIKVPITNYAPRHLQTPFYPGNPETLLRPLPREVANRLTTETSLDRPEIEAYWEQWTCISNTEIRDDPDGLHLMMDRKTFDRFLIPSNANRYSAPNLIHDRMFAFYDQDHDGMISFSEYLQGLAYRKSKNKLKRIFQGYDINGDGYVDRKDFLRIFRSYYVLYKSMRKDMLESMDESAVNGVDAHALIHGRQPLSSAFGRDGQFGSAHPNRNNTAGKRMNQYGDMDIADDRGVIIGDSEDHADRDDVFRNSLGSFHNLPLSAYLSWLDRPPRTMSEMTDRIREAVMHEGPLNGQENNDRPAEEHEITDDQRVRDHLNEAMHDRWRRRQFYTDEEEGAEPPADWSDDEDIPNGQAKVEDGDDEDYENIPHRPVLSPRSRSSSKVRFAEDMDDYDTRSNPSTSSRSIPERWGGIEIAEAERDVGKDVLYQVTQQAFNELLDNLFKNIEDEAISSLASSKTREKHRHLFTNKYFTKWAEQVDKIENKSDKFDLFSAEERKEKKIQFDEEEFNANFRRHMAAQAAEMASQPVDLEDVRQLDTEDLLAMSGYSIDEGDAGMAPMSQETDRLAQSIPSTVPRSSSSDATLPQALAALQPGATVPAPQRGSIPRTPRRGSETPSENLRRDMVAAFAAAETFLPDQIQEDVENAEDMPLPSQVRSSNLRSFGALNTDPNDATEGLRAYRDPALNNGTYRDPTLPQFRPNSVMPQAPTPPSAVTGEFENDEESMFVDQDEPIPSGRRPRSKGSGRKSRKTDMHEKGRVKEKILLPEVRRKLIKEMERDQSVESETRIQLSHWNWMQLYELRHLEQVEINARKRGGWARINYQEFEEVLRMKDKYWKAEKERVLNEERENARERSESSRGGRMRPGRLTGTLAAREREMERMVEYLGSWVELCIQ